MQFKIREIDNGYIVKYWYHGENFDSEESYLPNLDDEDIKDFLYNHLNISKFTFNHLGESEVYSFNNHINIAKNK